jgi:hypothetical protein
MANLAFSNRGHNGKPARREDPNARFAKSGDILSLTSFVCKWFLGKAVSLIDEMHLFVGLRLRAPSCNFASLLPCYETGGTTAACVMFSSAVISAVASPASMISRVVATILRSCISPIT